MQEGLKAVVRGVHSVLLQRKEKKWLKVGGSPSPTNYLWGPEKKWLNTVNEKAGLRTPVPSGFSRYTPGADVGLFIQGPMERI